MKVAALLSTAHYLYNAASESAVTKSIQNLRKRLYKNLSKIQILKSSIHPSIH